MFCYFEISAIYNFGKEGFCALPLTVGEVVQIYEEYGDWYYGCKKIKGTVGIFPKSYIHILNDQTNVDTLIHEITNVLREWGHHWKHLYVVCIKYMILLCKKLNNVK